MLSPRARAIKLNRFQHEPFMGGWRQSFANGAVWQNAGAQLDRVGRVIVEPDLSVPGHQYICSWRLGEFFASEWKPLPGVAPVAMQSGQYVATDSTAAQG